MDIPRLEFLVIMVRRRLVFLAVAGVLSLLLIMCSLAYTFTGDEYSSDMSNIVENSLAPAAPGSSAHAKYSQKSTLRAISTFLTAKSTAWIVPAVLIGVVIAVVLSILLYQQQHNAEVPCTLAVLETPVETPKEQVENQSDTNTSAYSVAIGTVIVLICVVTITVGVMMFRGKGTPKTGPLTKVSIVFLHKGQEPIRIIDINDGMTMKDIYEEARKKQHDVGDRIPEEKNDDDVNRRRIILVENNGLVLPEDGNISCSDVFAVNLSISVNDIILENPQKFLQNFHKYEDQFVVDGADNIEFEKPVNILKYSTSKAFDFGRTEQVFINLRTAPKPKPK